MEKILCVDDDAGVRSALHRVLQSEFEVFEAATLEDAHKIVTANPDLAIILSDQALPDGKGLDFLNEIKNLYPNCVRAILSGQINLNDISTALNAGTIHRLVLKPWDNAYLKLQILEAMQNHRLLFEKSTLEKLSLTDPVTQLANHRRFQETLAIEFTRALRHGRSLALLMIDVDRFKTFNDTYGHPVGDRCLKDAATRLLAGVRTLDLVARYGGDEFAVIMPDTEAKEVLKVGERLRLSFANDASDERVTISIGAATSPGRKTAQELVETADRALYKAKAQGRNQTVLL